MTPSLPSQATVQSERPDPSTLRLVLSGSWCMADDRSAASAAILEIDRDPSVRRILLADGGIAAWDSALPAFLRAAAAAARRSQAVLDPGNLPDGARRLWALSRAVPETPASPSPPPSFLERVGLRAIRGFSDFGASMRFFGELSRALAAWTRGRARCRRCDFIATLQECGPEALPIVSLISLLVGMILAFLGAVQLRTFGVEIFVADAVAVGMLREMGALMTGILLAGRTGAAFAARLGTMQVNEEIDALRTLGFSPMEFLVLPRVLALVAAMPLLTAYSNVLGILGGAIVGIGMLDLSPAQYWFQTVGSVSPRALAAGLLKSAVFGVLVALSGCLQGLRCGRSASAVGEATTAAVVNAIVYIVVADAALSILFVLTGF